MKTRWGLIGTRWDSLELVGTRWDSLGVVGTRWESLGLVGSRWESLGLVGTGWESLGLVGSGWVSSHFLVTPILNGDSRGNEKFCSQKRSSSCSLESSTQ